MTIQTIQRRHPRATALPVLGLLLLLAGCGKDVTPPNTGGAITFDPTLTPVVSAQVGDRQVTLTWTVEDSSNVSGYRVFRSKQETTGYTQVRSVSVRTYTDRDVQDGVVYFYQVASVLNDGRVSQSSTAVSANPNLYSVSIDGGAPRTRNTSANLQLNAPDGTRSMEISEAQDFAGAAWELFSTAKTFDLQPGDGAHTVWARFRDAQGGESQPVSDQITLDTRAFIDSMELSPAGGTHAPGSTVHLRLLSRGAESGGTATVDLGGRLTLNLNDQGVAGDTRASDGVYELDYTLPRGADMLRAAVTGHFTDLAGNQAPDLPADSLFTLHTPPVPVAIVSILPNGDPNTVDLELTWGRNTEPGFASYQIFRADAPSGMPAASAFGRLATQSSRDNVTYSDASIREGLSYAYRVDVMDSLGFAAQGTPQLATARLQGAVVLQPPVRGAGDDSLGVALNWGVSTDPGFTGYQIMRADATDTVSVPPDAAFYNINTVSGKTTLTYTDDAARDNSYLWYRVDEIGADGLRHRSNSRPYRTPNGPPPAAALAAPFEGTPGDVSLSWTRSTARDFQSYRVYRAQGAGADTTLSTLVFRTQDPNVVTVIDSVGVLDNTNYFYRVFVTDKGGLATASNEQSYTTQNVAPPGVDITGVSTSGPGVALSWGASLVKDFDSYRIYRSRGIDVSNGSTLAGTVTDQKSTGFFDAFGLHGAADTLKANADYYYRIYVYDKGSLFTGGTPRLVHTPAWSQAPHPPVGRRVDPAYRRTR